MALAIIQAGGTGSFITQLIDAVAKHGPVTVVLVVLLFLFWQLLWRVWDRAMKAKDEEIERLVKERDRYQELVFTRLISSEPKAAAENQAPSEGGLSDG